MKKRSWNAKRKGETYCAPACGRGCTHDEYLKAKDKGQKMLRALNNKEGWEINIHENLGWHVNLTKAGLSLYLYGDKYSTLLSRDGNGGEMFWIQRKGFKDPNKAVANQIRLARAHVLECLETIEKVDD